MLNTNIAILTNFIENLTNYSSRVINEDVRENNNIELFSILTFKDLLVGNDMDRKIHIYHSSSLPIINAMASPCSNNINQLSNSTNPKHNGKFQNLIRGSITLSLYKCEKIILSENEIDDLKLYEIDSMMMSNESFNLLKNVNFKNINNIMSIILKSIVYSMSSNDIDHIADCICKYVDIRCKAMYESINVNIFTPRYYINDVDAYSIEGLISEVLPASYRSSMNDRLPQYNPNTITSMYWDSTFLYPIHSTLMDMMKQSPEFNTNPLLHQLAVKFNDPHDFSFRNISNFAFGDIINSYDICNPVIKYNNDKMMSYCELLKDIMNGGANSNDK